MKKIVMIICTAYVAASLAACGLINAENSITIKNTDSTLSTEDIGTNSTETEIYAGDQDGDYESVYDVESEEIEEVLFESNETEETLYESDNAENILCELEETEDDSSDTSAEAFWCESAGRGFTAEEIYQIASVVTVENGDSCWNCQYMTACVVINRYLDWGYSSIYDTVCDPGQWRGYVPEVYISDSVYSAVTSAITNTDRQWHYQGWAGSYTCSNCGEVFGY